MLDDVVREAARRFGDRPCFVDPSGAALTYAELDRLSDQLAGGLAMHHGIGAGSVVCLVLPSGFDYAVAYAALSKLGALAAGVNPKLSPAELAAIVEIADPDLVLGVGGLLDGLDLRRAVIAAPWPRGPTPSPIPPDDDRAAAIVFTSGTTGLPKGALFLVRQLRAIALADLGPAVDEWDGGGPMIASTHFAHIGFMTKLPWYLQHGITTFLVDRWRADDVLDLLARERVTSLGVVAPQLALMLRSPHLDEVDVSSVTTIIAGGAASPPALVREAREHFGAAYSIRYSSTESGGVGLGTAFDAPDEEALHTIGRPRPGVEIDIRDDDNQPVTPGEVGELVLRSPAMFDRYWRDPAATAAAVRNGWLHTGDLARVITEGPAAGCVQLVGRRREMYVRGGYNVYPAEVEAVLADHPAIAEIAVAPRADEVMGEVGVAVVVVRNGYAPPSLAELRDTASERLARWKLPEALVIIDQLPMTPMQKIDRRALHEIIQPADS